MALSPRDTAARRKQRTRTRLKAVGSGRARLTIFRSDKNIYAQVIDDAEGKTVAAASSIKAKKGSNTEAAAAVGKAVAEAAIKAGVKDVVFDRGSYIYHGRVKALADAAREAGLNF
jgi:large subunit ribosomal protein L18